MNIYVPQCNINKLGLLIETELFPFPYAWLSLVMLTCPFLFFLFDCHSLCANLDHTFFPYIDIHEYSHNSLNNQRQTSNLALASEKVLSYLTPSTLTTINFMSGKLQRIQRAMQIHPISGIQ